MPSWTKRAKRSARRLLPPTVAFVALFVAWDLATRFLKIPPFLLPTPVSIWIATTDVWAGVMVHGLATLRTIALGFALSIAAGIPLAVLIASSPLLASALYPLLVLIQSVPKVALAPILVVALGTAEMPRVIITFLVAFFPIVISAATGLMATPSELVELSRSLKASKLQEIFLVRLPFATPYIFSGLKVSATLAVIGTVVAEFVAADKGLGYLLVSSTAFFNTPLAFGAMLCLSAIAIVAFQLVVVVQRAFFRWSVRGETAHAE